MTTAFLVCLILSFCFIGLTYKSMYGSGSADERAGSGIFLIPAAILGMIAFIILIIKAFTK